MKARKILLIDDDPDFVHALSETLRGAGFATITANDGTSAEPALTGGNRDFDLAIVDLVLPGKLTGFDLISIMTRERRAFKIVATSAVYKDAVLKYVAEQMGADAFIKKSGPGQPFNGDQWLDTIRGLLPEDAVPGEGP